MFLGLSADFMSLAILLLLLSSSSVVAGDNRSSWIRELSVSGKGGNLKNCWKVVKSNKCIYNRNNSLSVCLIYSPSLHESSGWDILQVRILGTLYMYIRLPYQGHKKKINTDKFKLTLSPKFFYARSNQHMEQNQKSSQHTCICQNYMYRHLYSLRVSAILYNSTCCSEHVVVVLHRLLRAALYCVEVKCPELSLLLPFLSDPQNHRPFLTLVYDWGTLRENECDLS